MGNSQRINVCYYITQSPLQARSLWIQLWKLDEEYDYGLGSDQALFNLPRVFWLYKSSKTLVRTLCSNRHSHKSMKVKLF